MSYALGVPVGSDDETDAPQDKKQKEAKKYNQADLEEFCLFLYGLYEQEVVESK